jgi:hypothetical protein
MLVSIEGIPQRDATFESPFESGDRPGRELLGSGS